jgi:aquaporin Z
MNYPLQKRVFAEFFGTFWLVFVGCGSAVVATGYPSVGIGYLGVSLAFGLSVVTMAYALGHVSGAHLNPAITFGLVTARKFPNEELIPYVIGQLGGAILASFILFIIASGRADFSAAQGFAANGYGIHSPGGYSLISCLISEVVFTFMFVFMVLGATSKEALKGSAPLAIGLTLTLIHLVSIPITNTSVNPARSTGPALFAGGWAMKQLWLFWLAPLFGAFLSGKAYLRFTRDEIATISEFRRPERPLKRAETQ